MEAHPPTLIWQLTLPPSYAGAMQVAFGAPITSVMRENVRDEGDGHVIADTSSGGLRFHVALDRHEIEVPEKFTYHVTSKGGAPRVCILNRYVNIFVCDDDYKRCCGRIMIKGNRDHAPTCHARGYVSMFPQHKVPAEQRRPPERDNPRGGEYFLPPELKEKRTKYAKAVLTACAPAIVDGKLNGRVAQPVLCPSWAASKMRKQHYATAELPAGKTCQTNCRQFPCVAVWVKRPEEAAARAAAWPEADVAGMAGMSM